MALSLRAGECPGRNSVVALELPAERLALIESHADLPEKLAQRLTRKQPWLRGVDCDSLANEGLWHAATIYTPPPASFRFFASVVIRRLIVREATRAIKAQTVALTNDIPAKADLFADLREALEQLPLQVRQAVKHYFGLVHKGPIMGPPPRVIQDGLDQLRLLMTED